MSLETISSGRTQQEADGTYEALDLVQVRPGDTITVTVLSSTGRDLHTFSKSNGDYFDIAYLDDDNLEEQAREAGGEERRLADERRYEISRTSALEGWERSDTEHMVGMRTLVLLGYDRRAASPFLTSRVVLKKGDVLGELDPGSKTPNVITPLGRVAIIQYNPFKVEEKIDVPNSVKQTSDTAA